MKIYNMTQIDSLLDSRAQVNSFEMLTSMNELLENVKKFGDDYLSKLAITYGDGPVLSYSKNELEVYWNNLPLNLKQALEEAKRRITIFHKQSLSSNYNEMNLDGIFLTNLIRPVKKVGLYIPAGKAPLPSTVLMGAIPAKLAGVENLTGIFAASSTGGPNAVIMAACYLAGVDQVFTVGGAQGIMALALGTELIPKVDKIIGPGGSRVTAAKALVSALGYAGIDMLAGPSEICIAVDGSTPIEWTVADVLSQLEHGESSRAYILAPNEFILKEIFEKCSNKIKEKCFDGSVDQIIGILAPTFEDTISVINELAPEHLLLQIQYADDYLSQVTSAGSIFIGALSSESFGDYASGTNHILPTGGQARVRGGLSVRDFEKFITMQNVSQEGYKNLYKVVEELAEVEGLFAHKYASEVRRQ